MSPTQALASELLGQDVAEWVRDLKSQKRPKWSWKAIAEELDHRTSGQVSVTGEAIRQWVTASEVPA